MVRVGIERVAPRMVVVGPRGSRSPLPPWIDPEIDEKLEEVWEYWDSKPELPLEVPTLPPVFPGGEEGAGKSTAGSGLAPFPDETDNGSLVVGLTDLPPRVREGYARAVQATVLDQFDQHMAHALALNPDSGLLRNFHEHWRQQLADHLEDPDNLNGAVRLYEVQEA